MKLPEIFIKKYKPLIVDITGKFYAANRVHDKCDQDCFKLYLISHK